jgi:hypothetical protein
VTHHNTKVLVQKLKPLLSSGDTQNPGFFGSSTCKLAQTSANLLAVPISP